MKKHGHAADPGENVIEDPFEYLADEHRRIESLFLKLKHGSADEEEVFDELHTSLAMHADLEEDVLYPRLREKRETRETALESVEEHEIIKRLLKEIEQMPKQEEGWRAKLSLLEEDVAHHVKEEESDLFRRARRALSRDDIDAMMGEMKAFHEEYV